MHTSILIGHFVKEDIKNIRNTFPSPVFYENHSLQVLLQTLVCLHKKLFCWLATIFGLAAAEWWQTRQDRILGKVLEHTKIFWQLTGQVRETHFKKKIFCWLATISGLTAAARWQTGRLAAVYLAGDPFWRRISSGTQEHLFWSRAAVLTLNVFVDRIKLWLSIFPVINICYQQFKKMFTWQETLFWLRISSDAQEQLFTLLRV